MTTLLPLHTDRVQSLLQHVEADRQAVIKLWAEVLGPSGTPFFPLDLMALGAVKRSISTAQAFHMMITSWNMVCARSLLRIHIDTSLRFSAAWLVEKPHEFAMEVLKGERIDKMKGKDGKRLTDTYLTEVRAVDYPWLPAVYKNLSGYVHFSGSHIYDSMEKIEDDGVLSFSISEADLKFPEFSWMEIIKCFCETTDMLATYLKWYAFTKQLSPSELEEARRQHQQLVKE